MNKTTKVDPLYIIFEQHLLNFQDPNSDRQAFLEGVVKDYLIQIRKMGLSVPGDWESHIFEELCFQVNTMLVKKIYGCLTINEFIEKTAKTLPPKQLTEQKKRAQKRYQSLKKSA